MEERERTYEDGLRDGKVEALEDRLDGIEGNIQGMANSLRSEFTSKIEPIGTVVEKIGKALLGNGDPSSGLAARFEVACNRTITNRWLIGVLLVAVIGVSLKVIVF